MAETIYISATEVRFDDGKFDSDKFYFRGGTGGAAFPMVRGRTIDMGTTHAGGSATWQFIDWKFDSTNYTQNYGSAALTAVATTVKLV